MDTDKEKSAALAQDQRRRAILNAAMAEFANGYDHASTDAIVRRAGVSKGLLFHYFGSKKELFLKAYEEALQCVAAEVFDLIRWEDRDLLSRLRQLALLKMDLMQKSPEIFDFIAHASFPEGATLSHGVAQLQARLTTELTPKLFYDVDRSLFREDICVDAAIAVVVYTMEGYARDQANPQKSAQEYYQDYGRYLADLDRFAALFRSTFYREEIRS